MRARAEQVRVAVAHPEGADGKAAAEGLGHREAVGEELIAAGGVFEDALKTLEAPAAEVTALHGVDEEEKFLLIAELPEAEEVFRGRGGDAAFALYAFNQYGGGGGGKGFARRIEIVEGNMPEAGNQRLETFLHFLLTGGGDAGEGAPVKGVFRGENLKAAFVMAKLAREFVETFVGLGAGIAEEDLAGCKMLDDALGEASLRLVVIEIGDVQEFLRLLGEGGGDFRMRVAEGAHGDAAAEVEVAPAIHIPDVAARATGEREIKARVGGQDVFREQFADGLELIPHNGRRRRKRGDDFFHLSRASLSHKARRVQTKNSRTRVLIRGQPYLSPKGMLR